MKGELPSECKRELISCESDMLFKDSSIELLYMRESMLARTSGSYKIMEVWVIR